MSSLEGALARRDGQELGLVVINAGGPGSVGGGGHRGDERGMTVVYRPGHPLANENGMVKRALAGEKEPARSHLRFPMLISDQIEIKSMVDGMVYTSKAALRRSYRDNGYVEVGNEELRPAPKMKPDRGAVRDSVGRALNRVGLI